MHDAVVITLLGALRKMPPYAVRLLARDGRKALTSREIEVRGGLSGRAVKRMSVADNWNGFKVEHVIRFMASCGVELFHTKRHLDLIRKTNGLRDAVHLKSVLQRDREHRLFYTRLLDKMPKLDT